MSEPALHCLYTAAQTRYLDTCAIEHYGVSGLELMERAAQAAWHVIQQRWPQAQRIHVLCGPGNNGGDGFLVAKLARQSGLDVSISVLASTSTGDAASARRQAEKMDMAIEASLTDNFEQADVIVDGLFGSGLSRPLQGAALDWVTAANASGKPLLALDVPSGLHADSGQVMGSAIHARHTACFIAYKQGLFTGEAKNVCGQVSLHTLDLPESLWRTAPASVRFLRPPQLMPRPLNAHKGHFGKLLVIGGYSGMGGAVCLTAEAALRSGAGLVRVATRPAHVTALLARRPELMPVGVDHPDTTLPAMLAMASVIALGPGLGQASWSKQLWELAMDTDKPTVLDADGLNLLAQYPRTFDPDRLIMTPHPGEASRLLNSSIRAIEADRFTAARALANRYRAVVVLKGAGTLVAHPDGDIHVCPWGNPGMASGGMGDVLTGIIASLLAQHYTPWQAACLGVGLHAQAGDEAAKAGERGLVASDLFMPLRQLVNKTMPF